jgi:ankyrin repeat protein
LEFKDPLERNLLYIAARNGHVSICEYLINKGMNVNEVQKTGSTALHGAAYYGQINVIKVLLNYGAKTNIKNNFGHLPIDEAMTEEIKTILKESEEDKVLKLYRSLLSKNIAYQLIPINHDGTTIGKKIMCKLINLPKQYKSLKIEKDWVSAWH